MGTGICWSASDLLSHYNLLNNPLRCDCPHFSDENPETQFIFHAQGQQAITLTTSKNYCALTYV